MRWRRFRAVTAAQLKMQFRNRIALFWALVFPIILMGLLGLLFGSPGAGGGTLGVVDGARNETSAAFVRALRAGGAVDVERRGDAAAARADVRSGDLDGVLLLRSQDGRVAATLLVASNLDESGRVLRQIVAGAADDVSIRLAGEPPAVVVSGRAIESTELAYVDFLLPGVVAIAIMISSVYGISTVLVDWRKRGILRRLKLTAMPLWEFLLSRVAASLVLTVLQVAVLLAFGRLAFGVTLSGTAWAAVPMALVGALCFLALGFFIGSLVGTPETADAVVNTITNPMMFLSGTFVPIGILPDVLERLAHLLPLYYLARGLRDIVVRGASLADVAPDVAFLVLVTAALAAASVRVFRWEPSS
jgi:ABC-2 type transport system permease protein